MGRYKNIEIEGLLVKDFGKMFLNPLNKAAKSRKLTEEEFMRKIAPHFHKLLSKYEETVSTYYVDKHKFKLEPFLKSHFIYQKGIATSHKKSFEAFILYINGCYHIYEKIISKLKRKKIDSTLTMNVSLYGLVIRRADEILNLLLSGYVDGAMIVWRSLYENSIILLLLAIENDNELVDKYYQHSVRNSWKKVQSYNQNHKELNFPKLPLSTEKDLKSQMEKADEKHGKEFLNNEYGWADNLFPGKQKANFRLLEERVEMSRFRPYYLLCCEHLHPSFNSFKHYMHGNKIILSEILRKDIDLSNLIDPMQFTVNILDLINDYILYEFSVEEEYTVNVLLMNKIFKKQQQTFNSVEKKQVMKATKGKTQINK